MSSRVDFSTPVAGPAYSLTFRAVASIVVFGLLAYGVYAVALRTQGPIARDGWLFIGAVLVSLLGTYYLMMSAVTTIDAEGIRQSGLVDRRVAWNEIGYARVRRIGATRLTVRKAGGRFVFFFGGSRDLEAAFDRIAAAYPRR